MGMVDQMFREVRVDEAGDEAGHDPLGGRLSEVEAVLAKVRDRALTEGEALDAIGEIVEVRRGPTRDTYQKPWG